MATSLLLADIDLEVIHKDIKNVHLSVYPPDGRVRVSVPSQMPINTVRAFLVTKLGWIRREREKFQAQVRHEAPLYIDRESHHVWGERYLLSIEERDAAPAVELGHSTLTLSVRPGSDAAKREEVLSLWFRELVRERAEELLPKWQPRVGVAVEKLFVQRMKTKWGSCNPTRRTVRLNTELAKKPPACLEYILVHELVHIHEPTHNARFQELMDHHLPKWRDTRVELNRRPLSHEDWRY